MKRFRSLCAVWFRAFRRMFAAIWRKQPSRGRHLRRHDDDRFERRQDWALRLLELLLLIAAGANLRARKR